MKNFLVVDDHPMIQIGLSHQLRSIFADSAVHIAGTFAEMVQTLTQIDVDLVVLDLGIPGGKGIAMISEIRQHQRQMKILVFSARDELLNAPLCMQAGADGFLPKMASQEQIRVALETIMEGKRYASPTLQRHILSASAASKPFGGNIFNSLSPREKEVLLQILEGKSLKLISLELRMKQSTVSTYKNRLMQKLEVDTDVELIKKMIGLIAEA